MIKLVTAAALAATLAGCSQHGGLSSRARPDEFAVARAAPLVVPPDFALRPPKPGEPRAMEADSSALTLQAMFGGPAPRSAAESAAVNAAGGNRADPGIRSDVGDPSTTMVDKGATTRDIIAAPAGDGQDARTTAQ